VNGMYRYVMKNAQEPLLFAIPELNSIENKYFQDP